MIENGSMQYNECCMLHAFQLADPDSIIDIVIALSKSTAFATPSNAAEGYFPLFIGEEDKGSPDAVFYIERGPDGRNALCCASFLHMLTLPKLYPDP